MKINHPIFSDIFPLSRWKKTLVNVEYSSTAVPDRKDVLSVELIEKMHEAYKQAASIDYSTYRLAQIAQAYRNELFEGIIATAIKQNSAEAQK